MVSPDRTRDGHPAIAFVVPFSFEGRKRSRHARPWRARERGYEHDGDRTERRLLAEGPGGTCPAGSLQTGGLGAPCRAGVRGICDIWCKSSCSFQVAVAALYFYIIRAIKLLTVGSCSKLAVRCSCRGRPMRGICDIILVRCLRITPWAWNKTRKQVKK
jgi:hypothetical protein